MAGVVLENVSRVFERQITAVDKLNLRADEGQFIVLVGPSGCGKTTTLRIIAGLEKPDSGNIFIDGRIVNDVEPKDRDVAMVFQNFALYPHMNVFENIAFPLRMRKIRGEELEKKVRDAAGILGILDLLGRKSGSLSGGQCQRAAIGRAIVRRPKVFLYDEPMSNIDAQLRSEMRGELKAIHGKVKTTTIYVTHDQAEAMALADNICVMNKGRIHQTGTPQEIYNRPADRFTASFFGMPAMNFFEGRAVRKDGRLYFVLGEERIILPERFEAIPGEYYDKELVLGIRPQDLYLKKSAAGQADFAEAKAETIEMQGAAQNIYMAANGLPEFIVSVDSNEKTAKGENLRVYLDAEKVHIFVSGAEGKCLSS